MQQMQNEFTVGQALEMWNAGIALNVNDGMVKSVVFETLHRKEDVYAKGKAVTNGRVTKQGVSQMGLRGDGSKGKPGAVH